MCASATNGIATVQFQSPQRDDISDDRLPEHRHEKPFARKNFVRWSCYRPALWSLSEDKRFNCFLFLEASYLTQSSTLRVARKSEL